MNLDKDLEEIKLRETEIIKLLTELSPKLDCKCVRENLELLDKKKMTLKFKEPFIELGTRLEQEANIYMDKSPSRRNVIFQLSLEVTNAKNELFLEDEVLYTSTNYYSPTYITPETDNKFVAYKIIVTKTSIINGSGVIDVKLEFDIKGTFIFKNETEVKQPADLPLRKYFTLDKILPENLEIKYRGNILKPNFTWRK